MASRLSLPSSVKATGPSASMPSARARRAVITSRRVPKGRAKAPMKLSRCASSSASTGTAITLLAALNRTGRPARNSARPRSTAIFPGGPNKPETRAGIVSLGILQASDARSNDTNPCTNADIPVSDPGIFAPAGYHTMKRSYKQGVSLKNRSAAMRSGGATQPFDADGWEEVPAAFRSSRSRLTPRWEALFGPLRTGSVDDLVVVAQTGQSLDGRIATPTGHS